MTVLEAIQRSSDFLSAKGVESPRLNSELLLAHVLGVPRMKLYLNFGQALPAEAVARLRNLVVRRGKREPLQQITGTACFCGLDFRVGREVLTPRPETELLAEAGWKVLGELQTQHGAELPGTIQVLDFGTGSGCLAITIAVKFAAVRVTALDISGPALEIARSNAEKHQVADRISFVQGDGFGALLKEPAFDLILANPPYIPGPEIETLSPEVRDFEPRSALDGGIDGLEFYRRIAAGAKGHLRRSSPILMEFGDGQAPEITKIFQDQKWIVEPPIEDYTGRARILLARNDLQS